jgi:hypothetical protein
MQYVAENGSGSGQASRFVSESAKSKLVSLLSDVIHPLLGSSVPKEWVDVRRGNSITNNEPHKVGAVVFTPYGEGTVVKSYPKSGVTSVQLPSGTCFVHNANVYSNKSKKAYTVGGKASDAVLLLCNNKLYMFIRLYTMLYNRLRRAKELCRRASGQKKTIVRHWKDRVAATPRSPDHRSGQPPAPEVLEATSSSSTADGKDKEEEALQSQLRSHKTYDEFLDHLYNLVSGDSDNSTFEDTCRSLMGASTASYMMFTLDKLRKFFFFNLASSLL